MNLRLKLLLLFAIGELLVLMFFGYIAYDTAKLTNTKNEIDLLASLAPHLAEDVADNLKNDNVVVPSYGNARYIEGIYAFITDAQEELVTPVQDPAIFQLYSHLKTQKKALPQNQSGKITVGNFTYVWARVAVPEQKYELTVLRQAQISQANSFFREMGVSLIVAAVIMLWVASWAAMYVSMLIEKLNEQKDILKHRSLHDVLTSLPNRALLNDRLQQLIASSTEHPSQFAVCFIDLNRFKDVNDTLGHHVGDELLLEISKRLKMVVRKHDTVARLGGDEFALILNNVSSKNARVIAEKILKEIETPVEAGGHKLLVNGSMGIAMFPEHGENVQLLLKNADVAMYAAKRSGTRLEFYSDEHEIFTRDKLTLTHDLHKAIDENQLELYYQPKYDITQFKVVGVEALLRWNHPVLGQVSPVDIIQLAEHSGLINPLSKWVMKRAFEDSSRLIRINNNFTISINLSAHYLQDPNIETDISALLKETKVDARNFILELTESAMFINLVHTNDLLNWLTHLGFKISVDDFGTGFSTLTNLRRLPISELKIDRSFVDKIVTDAEDASIVDAMIGLGSSLDIDVVAEGVETQEVLETLRNFGCHTIQGYLISKPIPLDEFVRWVNSTKPPLTKQAS